MPKQKIQIDPRTTPAVRISYPAVFEKRAAVNGGTPAYGIVMMFEKSNKDHMAFLKLLMGDLQKVLEANWPNPATRPRIPHYGHDKSPIKDGDKACNQQGIPLKEKNPEYAGHWIVRVANYSDRPLPVVDRGRNEILDRSAVYGGCYCKVNINPYARFRRENPGVSIGLNGVQKWADGEPFGNGAPPVEDMFEADAGADDPLNYDGGDPFADAGGQMPPPGYDQPDSGSGMEDDIPF